MKRESLLLVSFAMAFLLTSVICYVKGYPLIYYPISFGIREFIKFGILIGVLSAGLVYIHLPFLKWLQVKLNLKINKTVFYIGVTIIVLQLLSCIAGWGESYYNLRRPDFLYYYHCVGNSCVYLFSGNLTAILVAFLFPKVSDPDSKTSDARVLDGKGY